MGINILDNIIASYVLSILETDSMITCSWGFQDPQTIKNGLRFYVQGFLFKGYIEVIYNSTDESFNIRRLTGDDNTLMLIENVSQHDLM